MIQSYQVSVLVFKKRSEKEDFVRTIYDQILGFRKQDLYHQQSYGAETEIFK